MRTPTFAALLAGCLLLATGPTFAADLRVPSAYADPAAALAAARAGDVIILAPGTYPAVDLVPTVGVTLRGAGADPGDTVLDAGGQGRILTLAGLADSTVIENLTLIGGHAAGTSGRQASGGALFIDASPVRLTRCVLRDNVADAHGGAIRIARCAPAIAGCTFLGNAAPLGGGGAVDASFGAYPEIRTCLLQGNSARWGGAVSARAAATVVLVDSRLVGNSADVAPGYGGAVYADGAALVGLMDMVVSGNSARYGGGAMARGALLHLGYATVTDNRATLAGGGLLLADSAPNLTGTIVAFNTGTGLSLREGAAPVIVCSDVYGNTGGDWTAELLAVADPLQNYEVDPEFCTRDPLAANGLRLDVSSSLIAEAKSCGVPGIMEDPCGATPIPDVPVVRGVGDLRAFPNPFNPRTMIAFDLGAPEEVEITVHDARGGLVRRLARGVFGAGPAQVPWDGRDDAGRTLGSGVYFAVVRAASHSDRLKLTLLK